MIVSDVVEQLTMHVLRGGCGRFSACEGLIFRAELYLKQLWLV
jgi:hypothetical protein